MEPRWKPLARWSDVLILGLLAAGSGLGLYALTTPWPDTPDGLFHLHRTRALAQALRWGILYPRWFPDFSFGYGYPVLNFYAPAYYYPPALLHLAGLDLITATRVALGLLFALSGLAAYLLLRRWARPLPALVGAILYLVYPYHLYDLFVRGALPEFAAFLWPPLTLWATLRARDPSPRPGRRLALAALTWAGLLLTHNLTALMWIPLALGGILFLSFYRFPTEDERRGAVLKVGLPALAGVLLAGFYVVPVLAEMRWVGIGATPGGEGYARHFSRWTTLFDLSYAYAYPPASEPTVPVPAYAGIVLVLGLGVLALRGRARGHALAASWFLALLTLWLNTSASAWVWRILPWLRTLQFPWRWQAILALALAIVMALTLEALFPPRRRLTVLLYLALAAYLVFYAVGGLRVSAAPFSAADLTPEQMWAFDAEHGQVGASWTAEFLPRWVTEQRWAIGRPPTGVEPTLPVRVKNMRVTRVGYLQVEGTYEAVNQGTLLFRSFYYPAWRVEVEGRPVPTRPLTSLGLLAADVPGGERAFRVYWGATPAVEVGRILTALGWLLVFLFLVWGRGDGPRMAQVMWVGMGFIMLVGSLNLLARTVEPAEIQADYGPLVLSAVRVENVSGNQARVVLYWFVRQRPEPVTAFVHLVDDRGRVVAQHDGPIGGGYMPVARWLPGLLIPDVHPLSLPADLPPGAYRLKAGLYRPGYADQPLVPTGYAGGDPRVDIGVLEVRK